MDYTILDVILSIAVLLTTAYLIPAIKKYNTSEELAGMLDKVNIAVSAAEQIFKIGDNEIKYNYVDNILKQAFPKLSTSERQMLIEKTVQEMNELKSALVK